jgi:BirA family biotin operon repressor/biotin-[acetyl-CoA-carboxylase] ligase
MSDLAPLLDLSRLRDLLGPLAVRFDVDALASCTSTNTLLMERLAAGLPSGSVIVADQQTEGRGRRGRQWLSQAEDSLTFSLLWRFPYSAERLAGLSLAVGLAVAQALEKLGGRDIGLKWPNDILLAGTAKVGGILVELTGQRQETAAVIGIGLNLRRPPAVDQATASLDQALPQPERHQLLAALLSELAVILDHFSVAGFAPLRDAWQARHAWQGRAVQVVIDGTAAASGECLGADHDGALLIAGPDGVIRHLSGELSLRTQ